MTKLGFDKNQVSSKFKWVEVDKRHLSFKAIDCDNCPFHSYDFGYNEHKCSISKTAGDILTEKFCIEHQDPEYYPPKECPLRSHVVEVSMF